MPKEIIRSHNADQSLIFKWGRDDYTGQVGVDFGSTWFTFHADRGNGVESEPEYNSLWFTFETREDYNKAIRILRRMRDAQFGRDE